MFMGLESPDWAREAAQKTTGERPRRTPWMGNSFHDIFEGTEQIQQLVISRAISGLRIE